MLEESRLLDSIACLSQKNVHLCLALNDPGVPGLCGEIYKTQVS